METEIDSLKLETFNSDYENIADQIKITIESINKKLGRMNQKDKLDKGKGTKLEVRERKKLTTLKEANEYSRKIQHATLPTPEKAFEEKVDPQIPNKSLGENEGSLPAENENLGIPEESFNF